MSMGVTARRVAFVGMIICTGAASAQGAGEGSTASPPLGDGPTFQAMAQAPAEFLPAHASAESARGQAHGFDYGAHPFRTVALLVLATLAAYAGPVLRRR